MPKLVLFLAVLFSFSTSLPAAVTNVAWYRLGENDGGAASGLVVNGSTADLTGVRNLTPFGNPRYSDRVAATAASRVGSSLSVDFNGAGQYLSNGVVSTAVNNFGVEVWVKPNATDTGNRTIVYNGNPLFSGWGLIQRAGTEYRASLGTMTAFGSGVAAARVWTHLALVRDNGTSTFYVNGVASGTSTGNPIPPATSFVVATHPDLVANGWFNGAVDEIRVFTFAPGQFSTNDLLLNVKRAVTEPAIAPSATNAILNGSANPLGLATSGWFQWGTTTNYSYATEPQPVGSGIVSTSFSQQLSNLATHAFHYRAVASNVLGVAVGSDAVFTLTNTLRAQSGPAGGGQPIALGQPALELNFIICTNGNYAGSGDAAKPPFLGEVRLFAGNFAPAGWAFCHGQLLIMTNHTALFSILGTTYGRDNTNRFALPDTRSRSVITAGEPVGMGEIYLGETSGQMQTTLFPVSTPIHTHPLPPFYGINSGPPNGGAPRNNRPPYLALRSLCYLTGNNPLAAQTTYEPFAGELTMFAGFFELGSPIRAEGQTFAIAQNSFLYSIVRSSFGGNGTTTFALPDLRGRVGMGIGQGTGLTARTFGEQVGSETVIISTNQMPAHQHSLPSVPPIVWQTSAAGNNPPQPQTLIQPSLAVRFIISTNGEVPSPTVQATNKMIGQIQLYAGTNVPAGWALCDGQSLSVPAYTALFGVVSNFYGGDGTTTFALPDLRGRMPVGSPTGRPGATYGAEDFVMTEAQLPVHTHPVPALDYQSWCDFLGLAGTNAMFDADADGDGVMNGFEWATGTGLTNAASFAPLTIAAIDEQAKLRFSRNTNATDVTIHLQRTTALGDSNAWSGLVTNLAGAWSLPAIVSEAGTNSVKSVEVSDPLTNNPAADYRLKVTRP